MTGWRMMNFHWRLCENLGGFFAISKVDATAQPSMTQDNEAPVPRIVCQEAQIIRLIGHPDEVFKKEFPLNSQSSPAIPFSMLGFTIVYPISVE
jgi:hypothetical protein